MVFPYHDLLKQQQHSKQTKLKQMLKEQRSLDLHESTTYSYRQVTYQKNHVFSQTENSFTKSNEILFHEFRNTKDQNRFHQNQTHHSSPKKYFLYYKQISETNNEGVLLDQTQEQEKQSFITYYDFSHNTKKQHKKPSCDKQHLCDQIIFL